MEKNDAYQMLEKKRKKAALSSLANFRKAYLNNAADSFEDSPAHFEIMEYLDNLLKNPGKKLALAAPRGFGKTDVLTSLIIYALCLNKYNYIIILSCTGHQAREMLKNAKALILGCPLLMRDFPDLASKVFTLSSRKLLEVNHTIKIAAFGLKQGFRGTKHGRKRPDLVIVDDLDSDNYLHNRDVKERMREIFNGKVLRIGHERTNIIITGNLFSRNTLIWDVFNEPAYREFDHLNYQAIKHFPKNMDLWEKYFKILTSTESYKGRSGKEVAGDFYQDNQEAMDHEFVSLWPSRWSATELLTQFLLDPGRFKREMQNEPASGAGVFPREDLRFWRPSFQSRNALIVSFSKNYQVCIAVDPSYGNEDGDFCAIAVVAKDGGIYYVLQVFLLKVKANELIDNIFAIVEREGRAVVAIEVNGGQEYLASRLEAESVKRGIPIHLERITHNSKTSKDARISGLSSLVNTAALLFNDEDTLFIEQMCDFPLGKRKDGPDALEMAVRTLMPMKNGDGIAFTLDVFQRMQSSSKSNDPQVDETELLSNGLKVLNTPGDSIDHINKIFRKMHSRDTGDNEVAPKLASSEVNSNGAAKAGSLTPESVSEVVPSAGAVSNYWQIYKTIR